MTEHPPSYPETPSDFYNLSGPDLLAYCGADASKWSTAFCAIKEAQGWSAADIDEGLMNAWFANAIEHSSQVRSVAQAPSGPTLETKIRAVTRIPLIQIAADCHRSKWQFDMDRDELMLAAEARRLVKKAFNILHNIGDKAHKAAEALRSDAPTEGLVVSSTEGK